MKSHFTNPKYDFFKYGGKSRATMAAFNKRKDKYWFCLLYTSPSPRDQA